MAKLTTNNATLYYEMHGIGQPLILISGYTCDAQLWSSILGELCQYFQVVILDNRGVGQTQDQAKVLNVELMANDVIDLIKHLGLSKPHVVGHSMGGAIAQQVAIESPEMVNRLLLMSTVAKWRHATLSGLKALLDLRKKEVNFDLQFDCTTPWLFGEDFLREPKNIQIFKQALLANPYPQSLDDQKRQFCVLESFDNRDHLSKIQAETLVLFGEEDLLALPEEAIFLAKHLPHATYQSLHCGHVPMLEKPEALLKMMIPFFTS